MMIQLQIYSSSEDSQLDIVQRFAVILWQVCRHVKAAKAYISDPYDDLICLITVKLRYRPTEDVTQPSDPCISKFVAPWCFDKNSELCFERTEITQSAIY